MTYIALLMVFPVLYGLYALFFKSDKITPKEFACLELVCLAIIAFGYGVGYMVTRWSATMDFEVLSGRIVQKQQTVVSCEHSYQCNCVTTCSGDKNSVCTTTCSTCYDHSNDYNWDLLTDIGKTITIDRVDRQGVFMPQRWYSAYLNEPVVVPHIFKNYIKANPNTVLSRTGNKEIPGLPVPPNPVNIYDYYRVNRFLTVGYNDPNANDWLWLLDNLNATQGPRKQVNAIVVAVKTDNQDYSYLLEEKWLGGKKNDLIVLIGVPEYPKISWVKIISWSKSENMKVELRDKILEIGDMQHRNEIVSAIDAQIQTNWKRRHMADFEYLMAGIQPPLWMILMLFVAGALAAIYMVNMYVTENPFGILDRRNRYMPKYNGRYTSY